MKPYAIAFAVAALLVPADAASQAAEPRRLTLEEAEAYQMGMQLVFACSPYRHRRAEGSQSTIRRSRDALAGTAVHFSSVEGTYLVLEQYDQELNGHCLVVGYFGGALEPGRHDLSLLEMSAVEEEIDSGDYSFYAMSLVRTAAEDAVLVVESGSLDIVSMEDGEVTGTFEVSGFLADSDGVNRLGAVTWAGSFVAVPGAS